MQSEALEIALEDNGEELIIAPTGGSPYVARGLFRELPSSGFQHDTKGSQLQRRAEATIPNSACQAPLEAETIPWVVTARGLSWKLIGIRSGPVAAIATLLHVKAATARGSRPGAA